VGGPNHSLYGQILTRRRHGLCALQRKRWSPDWSAGQRLPFRSGPGSPEESTYTSRRQLRSAGPGGPAQTSGV